MQFTFWSIYQIRRVATKADNQNLIKLSQTQTVMQDVLNYCFWKFGNHFAFSTYQSIFNFVVI